MNDFSPPSWVTSHDPAPIPGIGVVKTALAAPPLTSTSRLMSNPPCAPDSWCDVNV